MSAACSHGISLTPLRGGTIGEAWNTQHGDRNALVSCHQEIRWTYSELDLQVERCARALLAAGTAKGDRVGIWSPNNAEWVVMQFATARIGAILVNINPCGCANPVFMLQGCIRGSALPLIIDESHRVVLADGGLAPLEERMALATERLGELEASSVITPRRSS